MPERTLQEQVYAIVRKIPAGTCLTYKQVAERAGRPKAYRAVGNILNKNYDPTIPCHRVIRSDGQTGGYNRGSKQKRIRLKQEGALSSMSMTLHVGDKAPSFSLLDQEGKEHALKDYQGQWVLLYFYPKDDTPGCTKEACGFRDNLPKFKKMKAVVFGISADSVKSHAKFSAKFKLPFTLLADDKKEVVEQYGVWAKKKFMGREYMGILRNSFLIDPKGKIAKVYEQVKPEAHPAEVLEDLMGFDKMVEK